MKSSIASILLVIFSNSLLSQVESKEFVISKIIKNSESIRNGNFSINLISKSAIGEDTSKYSAQYFFCFENKSFKCLQKSVGKNEILNVGKKTIARNHRDSTFDDYSHPIYKDFIYKSPIKDYLFKFYSKDLKDDFLSKKYFFKVTDSSYILSTIGLKFEFRKYDYLLINKKEWTYSEYGLQYDEFQIVNFASDTSICNDLLYSFKNFKKGFKKLNPKLYDKKVLSTHKKINFLNELGIKTKDFGTKKYILIDFFYQKCYPCIKSFPNLIKLHSDSIIYVIGISPIATESSTMEKFAKRYNINYPIICNDKTNLITKEHNLNNIYPFMVLIDTDGNIIKYFEGFLESHFKDIAILIKK